MSAPPRAPHDAEVARWLGDPRKARLLADVAASVKRTGWPITRDTVRRLMATLDAAVADVERERRERARADRHAGYRARALRRARRAAPGPR